MLVVVMMIIIMMMCDTIRDPVGVGDGERRVAEFSVRLHAGHHQMNVRVYANEGALASALLLITD